MSKSTRYKVHLPPHHSNIQTIVLLRRNSQTDTVSTKPKRMDNQNFTTTIMVDQTPEEVFNAINNVRGWWSGEIEGATDNRGAEFTYSVPGVHFSKQRITEFIPGRKIVWNVVDATLSFAENKDEWRGTDIVFDIAKKEGKTEVRFTHIGLAPAFECYNDCSNAWGLLINRNLKNLITTGENQSSPW
jgi:hypothetical protein